MRKLKKKSNMKEVTNILKKTYVHLYFRKQNEKNIKINLTNKNTKE